MREAECLRIALLGQTVDHRAARVGQPHHLGALVEGLARGVVDRRADDLHFERGVHAHDLRVAAAHQETQERKVRMGQRAVPKVDEVREDVPLKVVDFDHRDVAGDRKPLGERHAHEQRSDQPRAAREGDGVDPVGGDARLLERRVHDGDDVLLVGPRGQFGDHAAVFDVNRLRGDDVRQQDVVAEHGGRGVVTRGFDAENCNIHPEL